MRTAQVFISGFVQGVGFRQYLKRYARKIGVTGWVRNLSDGRVEAIFAGDQEQIDKLISFCRKGPFLSEVKSVDVVWENSKERHDGFEILETDS